MSSPHRHSHRALEQCAGVLQLSNSKLETGASYWHMVDLLWIFLFSLLYLLK